MVIVCIVRSRNGFNLVVVLCERRGTQEVRIWVIIIQTQVF